MTTMRFAELVHNYAYSKGMPNERFTFVPHPVTGMPAATCREYLLGKDPISGKPVIDSVVEALTKPLSDDDMKTGQIERPVERFLQPDTEENLHRLFLENGLTDGLPIVVPTQERVEAMLAATSHKPDEIVGKMQASSPHPAWSYTVEQVAVNAVMAGCDPEYFPVVLAIASTGVPALFTSTTSFTRAVVVNGPIAKEIGMNSSTGAMGPFNHANATIGRAWTLMSKNLDGGGKIGETYMGSQGNNLNYNNICFAEKEEALPEGWSPFHVQKGFKADESVVSLFNGWGLIRPDTSFSKDLAPQMPYWLQFTPFTSATLYLDPVVVRQLVSEGFDTKEKLSQYIFDNSKLTAKSFWGDYYHVQNFILPNAKKGTEPYASWLKLADDELVPRFRDPQRINVLVVGGEMNLFWQASDLGYMVSASIDKWK